jgi:acid-sensing ion channel, other
MEFLLSLHFLVTRNQYLLALNNFCRRKTVYGELENKTDCNDCLETIRRMKIPPEELFVACRFQNRVIDCKASFKEIILDAALCYTFNGAAIYRSSSEIHDQDWTIDGGYRSEATVDAYPRRALGAGKQFGLSVLLKTNKHDVSYVCHGISGFWIEFTMPYDCPQFFKNYYSLPLEDALTFVVDPKILSTANELRGYPSEVRKCYFSNEHRLKYFQEYTTNNCKLECEVDIVLKNCGCLIFFIEGQWDVFLLLKSRQD